MKRRSAVIWSKLVLLLISIQVVAEEWTSDEANYAVTVPFEKGWVEIVQEIPPVAGEPVFNIQMEDGRQVIFFASKVKSGGPVDDQFIRDYEKALFAVGNDEKISGTKLEVHGVPAYELVTTDRRAQDGNRKLTRIFIAQGCKYFFVCMGLTPDIVQDPDIRDVLASFRFLRPPQ